MGNIVNSCRVDLKSDEVLDKITGFFIYNSIVVMYRFSILKIELMILTVVDDVATCYHIVGAVMESEFGQTVRHGAIHTQGLTHLLQFIGTEEFIVMPRIDHALASFEVGKRAPRGFNLLQS